MISKTFSAFPNWTIRSSQKMLFCLSIGVLIFPLLFASCSKKESPSVSYDSQEMEEDTPQEKSGGWFSGNKASKLEVVHFDYDSSKLTGNAKEILNNNGQYLKENSNLDIVIEGHCDDRGSTEYNLALGERRANSVRNYLANLGISRNRMRTVSYGEEKPIARGNNEKAWAQNRRAEFDQK